MFYNIAHHYNTMDEKKYLVQKSTPFAESIIWQLNENYYHQKGLVAWSDGEVPHHITSNSMVGKTYAELIFALLCDLSENENSDQKLYILEIGAGHGRLCFHILHHLNKRIKGYHKLLPSYTYILSDIVEENLTFFKEHIQLQKYFNNKTLDVAYFDGAISDTIHLQLANIFLNKEQLSLPIVVIANYFFDTTPFDLLKIDKGKISTANIKIESKEKQYHPENIPLSELDLEYTFDVISFPHYDNIIQDKILAEYLSQIESTYLSFPKSSFDCLNRLKIISPKGIMLLTMDKGIQHLSVLKNRLKPEWITHGSFSFIVNFHAFIRYCELNGGKAMFSNYANFYLEVGCLLIMENAQEYSYVNEAFRLHVDEFGPDDYYAMMNLGCENAGKMNVEEIIVLLRLCGYDSTIFENMLVHIKKLKNNITIIERVRLKQTFYKVLDVFFNIGEFDIAFEMGGLLYDFGYFNDAIYFFNHSALYYGQSEDGFYNIALSYFQMKKDDDCKMTIDASNKAFPTFVKINGLIGMMENN